MQKGNNNTTKIKANNHKKPRRSGDRPKKKDKQFLLYCCFLTSGRALIQQIGICAKTTINVSFSQRVQYCITSDSFCFCPKRAFVFLKTKKI